MKMTRLFAYAARLTSGSVCVKMCGVRDLSHHSRDLVALVLQSAATERLCVW